MLIMTLTLVSCNRKPTVYDDGSKYEVKFGNRSIVVYTTWSEIREYDDMVCVLELDKEYMMCYENATVERLD